MIWFACKQCGKRHGRPEEAAGTVVFCECGQGNRVPWASPEPAGAQELPGMDESDGWGRSQPRRQPAPRRDPAYCLNHTDSASLHTCADCGEAFCADCVVVLQEEVLCGPCKNFRIRSLHRPAHPSGLAIGSLILGLIGGPFAYCLTVVSPATMQASAGVTASTGVTVTLTLIGLLVPGLALVLGVLALRRIETDPQVGGRSLAMTGMVTGLAGVLLCLTAVLIVVLHAGSG